MFQFICLALGIYLLRSCNSPQKKDRKIPLRTLQQNGSKSENMDTILLNNNKINEYEKE